MAKLSREEMWFQMLTGSYPRLQGMRKLTTDTFPSTVYSNFSPEPLPYRWDVKGDDVTISVTHGILDSTFTGAGARMAPSPVAGGPTPAPTRR